MLGERVDRLVPDDTLTAPKTYAATLRINTAARQPIIIVAIVS